MTDMGREARAFMRSIWSSILDEEGWETLLSHFNGEISWIGTEDVQIYHSRDLVRESLEAIGQNFAQSTLLEDTQYDVLELGDGCCLLYGRLSAWGKPLRFTAVCRLSGADWSVLHVHLSRGTGEEERLVIHDACRVLEQKVDSLRKQLRSDPLTRLYNQETSRKLIDRALSQDDDSVHGFVIADVDNLRTINENMGHLFGDAVLRELAKNIQTQIRAVDIVGRISGDKFVILLRGIGTEEHLRKVVVSLEQAFQRCRLGDPAGYQISGSIGAALYPRDGQNYDQLFEKADIALYSAKRQGRGLSLVYGTDIFSPQARAMNSGGDTLSQESGRSALAIGGKSLYTYLVENKTHRLVSLSEGARLVFPNARLGDACYKSLFGKDAPCDVCPLETGSCEAYNRELGWWLSAAATRVNLQGEDPLSLVCLLNITEFRRHIFSVDTLTGCSTISQFEEDVARVLAERSRRPYALICSDFEKFKYVNENYGYQTGNKVLRSFAALQMASLGPGEFFCRYSSDTFVTLVCYEGQEAFLQRMENRRQQMVEWSAQEFPGIPIFLVSGVYVVGQGDWELSAILDKANTARKSIKGSHTGQCAFYDARLHAQVTKEKEVELLMDDALAAGEFVVYLQPKVSLRTGRLMGAEALVRWQRSPGQLILPAEFIPLFEKNGFIRQIDCYMTEQVFRILRDWLDRGMEVVPISVNISRLHINDDDFISHIEGLLEKYNIPASCIEMELTESAFVGETSHLVAIITRLREMGFKFSIDDFGAGYSSLNLLRHLPIDVLKLDKDFFDNNYGSLKERAVLTSIITMAKSLEMEVLSEGVETRDQADFLRSVGCDLAQGYLYARPMRVADFEALCEQGGGRVWGEPFGSLPHVERTQ